MLAMDGDKKSLIHFRAAIDTGSTCGVDSWNWSTISRMRDPEGPGEESLEWDFLSRDSGSRW
jgi:hypothetical protein